ncbi:2'-5' RNA ligase [Sulfolobales archaeon HS-7]|nr:2'-5' RNA ligase [Sulfolobales archaeon HS-7]
MRVFVGIPINQDSKISSLLGEISQVGEVKLVELDNIHLTLLFIGEKPDHLAKELIKACRTVAFKSFEVSLKGIGVFPNLSRPRVIWIGVEKGKGELILIRNKLIANLAKIGIKPDDESDFSPHITLARVRGGVNIGKLTEIIERYSDYTFLTFNVNSFFVFKSTLTKNGPIYEELSEVKVSES